MATAPEQEDQDGRIKERRGRLRSFLGGRPGGAPTRGIDHVAVFALDLEATARFYTEVMGMRVTSVSPNRDEPRSTHMTVDLGNGASLAFFDFPHVERLKAPAPEGAGGMMHVAVPIPRDRYDEIEGRLKARGVAYSRIGESVYFRDPNGMAMELMIG